MYTNNRGAVRPSGIAIVVWLVVSPAFDEGRFINNGVLLFPFCLKRHLLTSARTQSSFCSFLEAKSEKCHGDVRVCSILQLVCHDHYCNLLYWHRVRKICYLYIQTIICNFGYKYLRYYDVCLEVTTSYNVESHLRRCLYCNSSCISTRKFALRGKMKSTIVCRSTTDIQLTTYSRATI